MSNTVIMPLTPAQQVIVDAQVAKERYIHRVAVQFDIFVNVIFKGRAGETISSRAGRAALEGKDWGILMCKFLDLIQYNHDAQAIAADLARAQAIVYLEKSSGALQP